MSTYYYQTKIGKIGIEDDGEGITKIFLAKETDKSCGKEICQETAAIKNAFAQITEFLDGDRTEMNFKIHPKGTLFQIKVWEELRKIPYGQTKTYKEIAKNVGGEKKCRAVGGACNKNPLLLAVPCHRVIGSNGGLVGFAAGLDVKKTLLWAEISPRQIR